MRYFITLSYLGARYAGWQIQPNAVSVQATLEKALCTILQERIEVTGCGRTDAGVHARYYVAHFDAIKTIPNSFLNGINSLLPPDIAIHQIKPVPPEAHARYDAFERSYEYHLGLRKDPFSTQTAWFYPLYAHLDFEKMQAVGALLLSFEHFYPFCKTDSGLDRYHCSLEKAYWEKQPQEHRWVFHVTANRFLRGMVRLMVGACLQVGKSQLSLEDVRTALENQSPLKKSLSVPAHGLFLTEVRYPY